MNPNESNPELETARLASAAMTATTIDSTKPLPVRSTFRLSAVADEGIRKLSRLWGGVSEKEVLDWAMHDYNPGLAVEFRPVFDLLLGKDAASTEAFKRKTRVVSGSTLKAIDEMAQEFAVSRDHLLDCLIKFTLVFLQTFRDKRVTELKQALTELDDVRSRLHHIATIVGDSDVFDQSIEAVLDDKYSGIQDEIAQLEAVKLWPPDSERPEEEKKEEEA